MRAAWLAIVVVSGLSALACGSRTSEVEEVETSTTDLSSQAIAKTTTFLDDAALRWVSKSDWGFVQGGRCMMSCHTTVPFMMGRAKLPAGTGASANALATLRGYVEGRVNNWSTVAPLYSWVPVDSRGLEAILNALALVAGDAPNGMLGATAKKALANMWAEQKSDGSFPWWTSFTLAPWENADAGVWGAALAAYVVGIAPASYVTNMTSSEKTKLDALEAHLRTKLTTTVPLHNRAMILLAASKRSTLLSSTQKTTIADAIRAAQSTTDGTWSAGSLGFTVSGGTTAASAPHAYATAYFTHVLASNADAADAPRIAKAKAWLEAKQNLDGSWSGKSLNAPTESMNNQFMSEAATAWAAMALVP